MTIDSLQGGQEDADCTVPNSSTNNPSASDRGAPTGECRSGGLSDRALVTVPWHGLTIALLAGLLVWGVLEFIMPVFELPDHLQHLDGNGVSQALREESFATATLVRYKNATLSIVLLAFTLAVVLSTAELGFRGNSWRAVCGGLVAGLVAAVIAVGAGMAGRSLLGSLELSEHPLAKTMIVQGAVMGLTGLGVGLGIALSLFRLRLVVPCVAGCLLGGLLAALVFPIVASVLLPDINTEHQMPDGGIGRLLWVGLPAALIGLTVTGLGKQKELRG